MTIHASLDALIQDLRYAMRRIRQRPGFAMAVIAVLALGIGATTAMFSAVDATVLRPLPFHQPRQLVALRDIQFPVDMRYALGPAVPPAPPHPHDVRLPEVAAMHTIFVSVAGYASGALNLGDPSRPRRIHVGVVTPEFFPTLGVAPIRGRDFVAEEGAPGGSLSAVISYGLWQQQYGGRDMLGHVILLGQKSYTVIGVMPQGFGFPQESELWIPMTMPVTPNVFEALAGAWPSDVIARLAPGVGFADASRRLMLRWQQDGRIGLTAGTTSPIDDQIADVKTHGVAVPLQRSLIGDGSHLLVLLLGATALLLLIACANVAHLLLSQTEGRRREVALRTALGATRTRIVRQLLTESVLLSGVGALLGIAVAPATAGLLTRLLPASVAGIEPVAVDVRVLGFAVGLAIITGTGLGLWPAYGVTRRSSAEVLKSGSARGAAANRGRTVLVASELAFSVTLLVCSVLLLRSFRDLMTVDLGIVPDHVGTLQMSFPVATVQPPTQTVDSPAQLGDVWGLDRQRRRVDEMIRRLVAVPGIKSAAEIDYLPLPDKDEAGVQSDIYPEGAGPSPAGERRLARTAVVSTGYFDVMTIPLIQGRLFTDADDSLAPSVAIVNRALAAQYWPGRDPIGRRFGFYLHDSTSITVVGVIGNIRDARLDQAPAPEVYLPARQSGSRGAVALVARGVLPPGALLAALRDAVHAVNPSQAVYGVRTMTDVVAASVNTQRTNTVLMTLFALLALLLVVFGIYSVVAYGIGQRARELGIRAALGATGTNLMSLIGREMAWCCGIGISVGLAGAWIISRLLDHFLFGVGRHDPLTFLVVPLLLVFATAVATFIPARNVLRVDPATVMRAE
jgi:putative ABC transport system permease protein